MSLLRLAVHPNALDKHGCPPYVLLIGALYGPDKSAASIADVFAIRAHNNVARLVSCIWQAHAGQRPMAACSRRDDAHPSNTASSWSYSHTSQSRAALAALKRSSTWSLVGAFMQQYDVPQRSVAVGRVGALVDENAFGFADREKREAVFPSKRTVRDRPDDSFGEG